MRTMIPRQFFFWDGVNWTDLAVDCRLFPDVLGAVRVLFHGEVRVHLALLVACFRELLDLQAESSFAKV